MIEMLCLHCVQKSESMIREELVERIVFGHFQTGCRGPMVVSLQRDKIGRSIRIKIISNASAPPTV